MKLHFKNKFEKVAFYILCCIAAALLAFYIWALSPEARRIQGIALLVTIACVVFGPVLVFSAWLVVSVIQRGASPYVIIGTIATCIYVNVVLARYGVFGAWMLFRK